jgi:hypothetical membrane protein
MNWKLTLKRNIKDPLRSFRTLQVIIAAVCILIPLTLKLLDHDEFYPKYFTTAPLSIPDDRIVPAKIHRDRFGFRDSVSDYVNGSRSYVFGILYAMASFLFIFNGVVYLRSRKDLQLHLNGHWFNVYIGLSLLGVALFPDGVNHYLHLAFSVLFFLGNILALIFIVNPGETPGSKILRIAMAVAVLLSLAIWKCNWISLLWAEWFSLVMIAIHLILVTIAAGKPPVRR